MKKYRSIIILIGSILLGTIVGMFFDTTYLKPFGDIFLNLMFTLAVPLIFTTVSSSIANMSNLKKLGKILKYVFIVFISTSLISAIFMFICLKIANPFTSSINLSVTEINKVSFIKELPKLFTVSDFSMLFSKSNILPLIVFSSIFGIAISMLKNKNIKDGLDSLSKICIKMVKIVMLYAPIGIFCYFASAVSEFGPMITVGYIKSLIIYFVASILYMLIFYTIYSYIAGGKEKVKIFWKNVIPTIITSFATSSSLATLPVNLKTIENMDVDDEIAKVSLPLGATMHMEGSSMGAILKIMFVFAILNIKPSILNILVALFIAILSAVVMAGVPGGGLIGEVLIISMYGLPSEVFTIIATIGILIDAPATMLNATGDIASTILIDNFFKKYK